MNNESRRGWITVFTTFITLVVIYGVWYSYSVFLVALLREFGWSRSLLSGAFSLLALVNGGLGPVTGWLVRRTGPRRLLFIGGGVMALGLILAGQITTWWHLYLAFGVITAIGMSLAGWVTSVVLVQGWFPTQFATAMGIASAGIGAGILGVVPLTELLIGGWGWRWAFRGQAIFTLAWMLPAAYWLVLDPPGYGTSRSDRAQAAATESSGNDWTIKTAARTWRFWGVAGVFFTGNLVTQMLLIHQVAYFVDHGVPPLTAAMVGGAVGLVSIPGKMGWGFLSDRAGRELAVTLAFGCVALSIGALVLAGRHPNPGMLYLYALLIGLGYSVLSPVFPAIASDLFRGPGFPVIYGTLYGVICLGLALGPWVAGRIFDLTGSYGAALWLGVGMTVLTPVLVWVIAPRRPNPPPARR
ncbi:MAG TPA: MFS transporter [Candidatus Methylomirabilis sp.]|nr:MFS transporter [Candidatus Methylomirabilis sp.]